MCPDVSKDAMGCEKCDKTVLCSFKFTDSRLNGKSGRQSTGGNGKAGMIFVVPTQLIEVDPIATSYIRR